jgi:hypothetical protein
MKFGYPLQILDKSQISNFMKIPLVVAELFHEDGRMEDVLAEPSSRFSQFRERT